jgi:hypothetical protein
MDKSLSVEDKSKFTALLDALVPQCAYPDMLAADPVAAQKEAAVLWRTLERGVGRKVGLGEAKRWVAEVEGWHAAEARRRQAACASSP